MGFFDFIGDMADGIEEVTSNFTVIVGESTFENVLTTLGEAAGGTWEIVGELADEVTKDVVIDFNDLFD